MSSIPIARPWLGEAEAEAARRTITSRWVAQGPEVAAFEQELAAAVGARHACAVSSGTAALILALRAAGVGPGDEVITASHSFIATANAVRHVGAVPVFADITPETFTVTPETVEALIGEQSRAILCAHQLGMPCAIGQLRQLARARGLVLIEDAACAVGSEVEIDGRWERVGRPHGDIACFSFHPRKLLTTGEGGAVTTSDPELVRRCRSLRQHAMVAGGQPGEQFAEVGHNFRMSDIHAAVGRVQLARLDEMVARRRELVARYAELLDGIEGITLPREPAWARSNWQSYCLWLAEGIDREAVRATMAEAGVATLGGLMCAHRTVAYRAEPWRCGEPWDRCGCPPESCRRLRVSEQAEDRCLILPLFHEMTDDEQQQVAAALRSAILELVGSRRSLQRSTKR